MGDLVVIEVKKLDSTAIIPEYQTEGSAGFDLHAIAEIVLQPGQFALVGTGLAFAIAPGYEVQVRPRSGLAFKKGVTVLNSPGTIDSDYRGEIGVLLINHGDEPFAIQPGDRVAQGVVQRVTQADFAEKPELSDTRRGAGGFGSTGIQQGETS